MVLKIKDPIHRQKISLKAMDVVLFGPSSDYARGRLKDYALAVCIVLACGGCWYAYVQKKASQDHMKKTLKGMEELHKAEISLMSMQSELDKAKNEQEAMMSQIKKLSSNPDLSSSMPNINEYSKISELEDELRKCRDQLSKANNSWTPPHQLQLWLQLTHELELKHYNLKKASAEMQLLSAKDGVSIGNIH